MKNNLKIAAEINNIVQLLHGKPAADMAMLPAIWRNVLQPDYVEAARLFRYHDTMLCMESLEAIGHDLQKSAYPNFDLFAQEVEDDIAKRTLSCLHDLFAEFGYNVPAAFYNALIGTLAEDSPSMGRRLFKNKNILMQDRLWDAVLHAMLLVTPIALYVHSTFSKHGLSFFHGMSCKCKIEPREDDDMPFHIPLNQDLKPAYLQNMLAAALEQYGVNASTSGKTRGF